MTTVYTELPLYSDLRYRYGVTLEGISYQFTFYWNARVKQWHMDIRFEDQTPLVLGIAMVPQYPMLVDYNLEELGMSGYFVLMPVNITVADQLDDEPGVMPEFFKFYYVYVVED